MVQQTLLDFGIAEEKTFANFIQGNNLELILQLQNNGSNHNHFLFISGQASSGKTHLLCAACEASKDAAAYFPLSDAKTTPTAVLDGMDALSLICLDDIDRIEKNFEWEEAVFHLYNRIKDSNKRLIISSRRTTSELNFQLPDLKSRLCWGLNYQISPLEDTEKVIALQKHAQTRGINLSNVTSWYLINHFTRDMSSLLKLLAKLDTASLATHRRLTIPFIKEWRLKNAGLD